MNAAEEGLEVEALTLTPGVGDQVGEKDVLAAGKRIGFDAHEAEEP